MSKTTQIRAQWEAKASEELGGRPVRSLYRRTADAIEVAPVYLRGPEMGAADSLPGQFPGLRGRTHGGAGIGRGWLGVQEYRHADVRAANAAARRDLELGADGLRFILDSELRAGRAASASPDGLVCDPDRELATLLDGIDPARTRVWFDAGLLAPRWADAFERWLDDSHTPGALNGRPDGWGPREGLRPERGRPAEWPPSKKVAPEPATLGRGPSHGGVIYDPFSALARTGKLACDLETALASTQDAVLGMRAGLLGVSTAVYHDAGASEADELALALSSCAQWLRHGVAVGLEFRDLADAMTWTLAIGGRAFEDIAKLRAARIVWAKFSAAAGLPHASLWIHATSGQRMWTRHGAWVNLLRGTVGGFAAAVGGADSIATAAFDGLCGPEAAAVDGLGRGSELGRRLALNTQLILREESQLARVIDPVGGSWYVESLTDALARAAWQRFRELEQRGGLIAGLQAGSIQEDIERAAARLRERAATRKLPLTGLSTYPTLEDPPTPDQPANVAGSTSPEPLPSSPGHIEVTPLGRLRLAAPFEQLRDAAQRQATRPSIYACNLGPLAAHQARLEFAGNCFAAAGIELRPSDGFALDDPDALIDAVTDGMRESGCALAIVCGRDQDYARLAAAVIVALRIGGAKEVWIAGRPPSAEHAAGWGLDPELPPRFVYLGGDVLTELELAIAQLGLLDSPTTEVR